MPKVTARLHGMLRSAIEEEDFVKMDALGMAAALSIRTVFVTLGSTENLSGLGQIAL